MSRHAGVRGVLGFGPLDLHLRILQPLNLSLPPHPPSPPCPPLLPLTQSRSLSLSLDLPLSVSPFHSHSLTLSLFLPQSVGPLDLHLGKTKLIHPSLSLSLSCSLSLSLCFAALVPLIYISVHIPLRPNEVGMTGKIFEHFTPKLAQVNARVYS